MDDLTSFVLGNSWGPCGAASVALPFLGCDGRDWILQSPVPLLQCGFVCLLDSHSHQSNFYFSVQVECCLF